MTVAELRAWRRSSRLAQKTVADAIGMSLGAYNKIECGDLASAVRPVIVLALERASLTMALRLGRLDVAMPAIRNEVASLRWDARTSA